MATTIGINVGLQGTPLPPIKDIVKLLKSKGVTKVRIYDEPRSVLSEFANQGINVSVTVNDVDKVAQSQQAANDWVRDNVKEYVHFIDRIIVGNEFLHHVVGKEAYASKGSMLLKAMQNIHTALTTFHLNKKITTAHAFDIIEGYPPSTGTFKYPGVMGNILKFLKETDSAFMVNIYPYFAYIENTKDINLDYALGNPNHNHFKDSGRTYTNLLDAMIDTVISAMTKAGYGNLKLIIGESGWPSAGGPPTASVDNARSYNQNLVRHVLSGKGSPLRPHVKFDTYIFALFNENKKKGQETEKHFGLYHPDGKTPVYPVNLSVS